MRELKDGISTSFFAEGTWSLDGSIQKFKKGGVVMAMQTNLPIVPITIVGNNKLLRKNTLGVKPGMIKIIIDNPIDTSHYKDRDILLDKVQTIISSNLEKNGLVSKFNNQSQTPYSKASI